MNYYPKRPIKSFQDLEVYQKLLAVSVAIAKKIKSEKVTTIVLDLPVKVAAAHSLRFSDQQKAIDLLEKVMLNCNLLVVYLEQYRDIENTDNKEQGGTRGKRDMRLKNQDNIGSGMVEPEFFEEQIKNLLTVRMKILHLQQSWKKFMENKNYEKK